MVKNSQKKRQLQLQAGILTLNYVIYLLALWNLFLQAKLKQVGETQV